MLFPFPGDLPDPGIKLTTLGSPTSPALGGGFFTPESPGKLQMEADSTESSPQPCLTATVPLLVTVADIHETCRAVASPTHGCLWSTEASSLPFTSLVTRAYIQLASHESLCQRNFVSLPRLRGN